MSSLQLLGSANQKPCLDPLAGPVGRRVEAGAWLGNLYIQGLEGTTGSNLFASLRPRTRIPQLRGHRATELEWRSTHRNTLRPYAGEWVVLEGAQILAHGLDPEQLVREARARGIQIPYVFKVEDLDDDVVTMGV